MTIERGGFGRSKLTFLSLLPALLIFIGACSSSLDPGGTGGNGGGAGAGGSTGAGGTAAGTGGTAGGGTGGCATRPEPSAPPFNCQPTYVQQASALCELPTYPNTAKRAGSCGLLQATVYGTDYYEIVCGYDAAGALVGARRCEDSTSWCGAVCITSANAPDSIASCGLNLPSSTCDADAGVGAAGTSGAAGTGGVAGTSGTAGGVAGTGGGAGCSKPASDPWFGCLPTYAAQSAKVCQHAGSCSGFLVTRDSSQYESATCGYDQQGALIWAERCTDTPSYCGNFCLASAGMPLLTENCFDLPSACDGGCVTRMEPSGPPFNCQPTYAQQAADVCALATYPNNATTGSCGSLAVTVYNTPHYGIVCGYDAAGALVAARLCEDSAVWCSNPGNPCITSTNAPDSLANCLTNFPNACGADAGRD